MAKLSGSIIMQKYAQGEIKNSFYQEQILNKRVYKDSIGGQLKNQRVFYIDHTIGSLKTKNTMLLG